MYLVHHSGMTDRQGVIQNPKGLPNHTRDLESDAGVIVCGERGERDPLLPGNEGNVGPSAQQRAQ
jgi:hypothetical protein